MTSRLLWSSIDPVSRGSPTFPVSARARATEQKPQGSGPSETPPVPVTGVGAPVRGFLDSWQEVF